MDDVESATIKTFLDRKNISLQLVGPHNHQVNAAEKAIQTFKNHLKACLFSTNKDFLYNYGTSYFPRHKIHSICLSQLNPIKSAYKWINGKFGYDQILWVPPSTRAKIFIPPKICISWGPHMVC